ncbi:tetratricopeptide repeat protein [Helicobacter mehlei]|uniref:beta-lactamase n=1 Tax=Helicobacter mehlei TaxID=2316080 RepID=A0A553ULZ6_9HELI|nr:SEL1-like repeat protein [Helicobacter mehlei]TSA81185.1 SEL1-like repeat protein [Helicobacter mehlei]
MIERVGLEFAERQRLEGNFAEFAKSSYKGHYPRSKDITKDLNQCLEKIGWVCALYKTPFKLLGPKGVQSVESMLIFAPQSILQEDLVNTAKLERAHGFYVCWANLDDDNGHIWLITCGAQNLKEAQNTPAFTKLFKNSRGTCHAQYHFDTYRYALDFLRLVALFDDLPVQDFKAGGEGSNQAFPRKVDVYFLRALRADNYRYFQKAIRYYEKSAELGDVEGFYQIGEIYHHYRPTGITECPNFAKALEYFKKAGEMGDFRAYEMLGRFYARGNGVAVDIQQSLGYLNLAADMGSEIACFNLADIYLYNEGVKDPEKAQAYYNKAIKMGKSKLERARICHRVAKRYLEHSQGAGLDKEDKKAVFYYQKAAILATEVFGAEAYNRMAYWGKKYYSYAQTLEWCLQAIELGNTKLYTYVGRSYYEGRGCVQNYQKALEYFQKAIAIKEDYEAYFALAEMYFNGEGVPQDYSKALAYYTKALGGRYEKQEVFRRLSQIYDKGLGVEPDLKKAFEYLKKSCGMWD